MIPEITLIDVKAERSKRSLFYFLKEFWNVVIKEDFVYNWHLEYLCDEIQLVVDKYVLDRQPHIEADKWYKGILENIEQNIVFNVPPGTTKSTILSRMLNPWIWCVDDSKSMLGNTIDGKNATSFSIASLDIIKSEKYRAYFPKVKIRRDASAKTFYMSDNRGERYSLTTRGSSTGKHVHILADDDPMDYQTAQSPVSAAECIEGFKALQSRKKDKDKTPYILVMQKLSSRDTSSHALKVFKGHVRHICLPAEDIYDNIVPSDLRQYYVDGLLDPKRLSKETLMKQKMGLNDDSKPISDIAYNIQYNQAIETGEDLLYSKLNFVDSLPEDRSQAIRFSFTDVADLGDDYFATWFVELNGNQIYVYDAVYTQEPSPITGAKIKGKIELHNSMINKMETNNQGGTFITFLQSQGVNINGYYSGGNKEQRITAHAQFMGYVSFVRPGTMPYHTNEYSHAVKHMQSYPKVGKADDGHDDAEDAATEMLKYFYTNYRYLFTLNQ